MTIAIGSDPAYINWRNRMRDYFGRVATKTTLLDGTIDDTHILQLATDFSALTRAQVTKMDFNARLVTGLPSSASDSSFSQVTDCAELTFSKVNPVDSSKFVTKSFLIPAIVEAGIVDTDKSLIVGTPGTGSLSDQLARLISNLETYLNMKGADGAYYPGSWSYVASESGKVSLPGI